MRLPPQRDFGARARLRKLSYYHYHCSVYRSIYDIASASVKQLKVLWICSFSL